jgi:predicted methyltransferase
MTEEQQEKVAKEIVARHIKDGVFDWNEPDDYRNCFPEECSDREFANYSQVIKAALLDQGIIQRGDSEGKTVITEKGKEFTSFADIKAKAVELERLGLEKLQLDVKDLQNKVFDYDKTKRQARLAIIYAGLSALTSVIAILIALLKT